MESVMMVWPKVIPLSGVHSTWQWLYSIFNAYLNIDGLAYKIFVLGEIDIEA
jgi:hypothetical protein